MIPWADAQPKTCTEEKKNMYWKCADAVDDVKMQHSSLWKQRSFFMDVKVINFDGKNGRVIGVTVFGIYVHVLSHLNGALFPIGHIDASRCMNKFNSWPESKKKVENCIKFLCFDMKKSFVSTRERGEEEEKYEYQKLIEHNEYWTPTPCQVHHHWMNVIQKKHSSATKVVTIQWNDRIYC